MRLTSVLAAGVAAVAIVVALVPSPASAQEASLTGDLPTGGGIALAVWSGGPAEELAQHAQAGGCNIVSVWANRPVGGGLVGYFPGALTIVNGPFQALYPGGTLPPSSPVFLVCRPGGSVGPAPSPPSAPPAPLASNISVFVQPGVDAADLALIEQGIQAADTYLLATFGRSVETDVRVNVLLDSPRGNCCFATTGAATLATAADDWVWAQASPINLGFEIRGMVAAHEFVHLFQFELGCIGAPGADYLWLIEGMAEWVGHHAVHTPAALSGPVLDYREWIATFGPDLDATLAERENLLPPDSNYSVYYLAVDRLVQGSSPAALGQFCTNAGSGTPWRTAFANAFGITVDAFYADFANYLVVLRR